MEKSTTMAMAAHNGHGPQEQSAKPALASVPEAMDDPLQKLAKQCDTISGDEEKTSRAGQRKNGQMQQNGHAAEGGMPKGALAGQPKVGNGKAKSPHKQFDPYLPICTSATAAFPNGLLPPNPAQLAAMMASGPFLPMAGQRPPPHQPMPPSFPPAGFCQPPQSGTGPFGQPAAQLNLMQQLMAAVQQQMPPPPAHFLHPGMFMPSHSGPPGIPLPPSMPMPTKKPEQQANGQAEAEAAALAAMAMFPMGGAAFPGQLAGAACVAGQQQQQMGDNGSGFAQQLLQQPIQALLMAAACGQLAQLPCRYNLPGGQPCGRLFASDDQLIAHYKSAHIAQMSSPSTVSSTTEGPASANAIASGQSTQTPTTTSAAGAGNQRARTNKNSPSSSRSTPTGGNQQQQQGAQPTLKQPHSNPGPMVFNGWPPQMMPPPVGMGPPPPQAFLAGPIHGNGHSSVSGQHRFHPYLMPSGQPNGQQQQQSKNNNQPPSVSQPNFQQIAMALNLMAGAGLGPVSLPGALPDQSLAALAAMTNSLGNQQPNGQSPAVTVPPAQVGAGSG